MNATHSLTRRHALRLAMGLGLAAVPAIALAGEVSAGRAWCRCDPTVRVNGRIVHLYVSGLLDTTYDVSGPTQVVIRVPAESTTEVLEQDAGFRKGYVISFVEDRKLRGSDKELSIAAEVLVPTTQSGKGQPVLVEWVPDGTVKVADKQEGKTNAWIRADTTIKRGK